MKRLTDDNLRDYLGLLRSMTNDELVREASYLDAFEDQGDLMPYLNKEFAKRGIEDFRT